MPAQKISPSTGRALTPGAIALVLMLCLSWGFNQIAVKLALPDVPPMMQALIRSAGALPVMLIAGWLRGVKFFERDGSLVPGLVAGLAPRCYFFWQCAQVPAISTTESFGANPDARAAALRLCATGAAGISPTEPQ